MKSSKLAFLLFIASVGRGQEIKTVVLDSNPMMHYAGTVNGKYKVQMNLTVTKTTAEGNYRYLTQNSGLSIAGSFDPANGKLSLTEKVGVDKITGYFEGVLTGATYSGTWYNKDRTKHFPFVVSTPEHNLGIELHASFTKEDDFVNLKEIKIMQQGRVLQTINSVETYLRGDEPSASLEDLNFDGYPDLTIVVDNYPANIPCSYWLYDAAKKVFVECKECSDVLFSTDVDLGKKRVNTFTRDGCCWHVWAEFVYQDGRYFKVRQEIDDNGNKSVTNFVVKDGKSVEVK